jgi:hypothetical protein
MLSEADEGLYQALRLRNDLSRGDALQPQLGVMVPNGQRHYVDVPFRQEMHVGKEVDAHSYFRLRPKWKQDPLKALALSPITLTVNGLSRLIATSRNTRPAHWMFLSMGRFLLTDSGIWMRQDNVVPAPHWTGLEYRHISQVSLKKDSLHVSDTRWSQQTRFLLPKDAVAWCYVALQFLAFGNRNPELKTPHGFHDRLSAEGRTL